MAGGKRAGARRGARPPRQFSPQVLGLCAAITLALIAWGYLIYLAIDFGTAARSGEGTGWWLLVVATVGAMACLFLALMLGLRLLRALGITSPDGPADRPIRSHRH
ncbi:MAG: hypothetical protein V9G04_02365 [Nocardioides sp.]